MLSKINLYLFRSFFISFLITFIVFAILIFIGDFIEQFRKSTNKEVPLKAIVQLSSYNFLSLTMFTLPVVSFFSSLFAFLYLIKNSELIVVASSGVPIRNILVAPIILYILIGSFFITTLNPLMSVFEDKYSELEYEYINKVDKFASITKNGIWLKQFNVETGLSSVLFAKDIKDEGESLSDFMILEYDKNGAFQGRLDGGSAKLIKDYWEMKNVHVSPKFNESYFKEDLKYHTNIKIEDISDSLSSPLSISFWRLGRFIEFLENLGYSAVDFKLHYYNLFFLPLFMSSLLILSASITNTLKQNDKFFITFIVSLILIFLIYFISNLFDALGSSSQISPFIAKGCMPFIVISLSILIFRYPKIIGR
tara:strand:+ start:6926 stop:8023 length:1098 start_codon:yes stop_codon:yes gene_type:complete